MEMTAMSISKHEQQVLGAIEGDLAATYPKLTAMLSMFTRLTAGEEMPGRERVRRVLELPSVTRSGISGAGEHSGIPGADTAVRPTRRHRAFPRLRRRIKYLWLVWVVIALAATAWSLTFNHSAGHGVCPAARTAACRHVLVPGGAANSGL